MFLTSTISEIEKCEKYKKKCKKVIFDSFKKALKISKNIIVNLFICRLTQYIMRKNKNNLETSKLDIKIIILI